MCSWILRQEKVSRHVTEVTFLTFKDQREETFVIVVKNKECVAAVYPLKSSTGFKDQREETFVIVVKKKECVAAVYPPKVKHWVQCLTLEGKQIVQRCDVCTRPYSNVNSGTSDSGPSEIGTQYNRPHYKGHRSRSQKFVSL